MAKHSNTALAGTVASIHAETNLANPDAASIAALAYQLWLAKGCPTGSGQDDWLLAEHILKSRGDIESQTSQ